MQACVQAQKQVTEAELMSRTVIFDGVPEQGSETSDAQTLLAMLGLRQLIPQEVHRLGQRKNGKPRKLKVICKMVSDRDYLLGESVRAVLRDRKFPIQGIYVNPSTPSSERRLGFLLRARRNELNQGSSEDDSYFLFRDENCIVRKEADFVDWAWRDDGFEDWVNDFEANEEKQRFQRSEQSSSTQHRGPGEWQKSVNRNGKPQFPSGNARRGMGP